MLTLTGYDLNLPDLLDAARGTTSVALAPEGLERMRQSREVIDTAIADQVPVYGVTTGLGARATEPLDETTLADFSLQTLRGRAHAIGPPMPRDVVRAAMILRANTLLLGHAGARGAVARHLVDCLNADLTPVVGVIGSLGVADLIPNATLGLALVGEGEMTTADGQAGPSGDVMRTAGIEPLALGPRDGLALANHASLVAAFPVSGWALHNTVFMRPNRRRPCRSWPSMPISPRLPSAFWRSAHCPVRRLPPRRSGICFREARFGNRGRPAACKTHFPFATSHKFMAPPTPRCPRSTLCCGSR